MTGDVFAAHQAHNNKSTDLVNCAHLEKAPKSNSSKHERDDHLIHSLSPNDWHAYKEEANQSKWRRQLTDKNTDPRERLHAAHELFKGNKRDLTEKDKSGRTIHFQISQVKEGKQTHISISQVDGKSSRIVLEGDLDSEGRVVQAKNLKDRQKQAELQSAKSEHEVRVSHIESQAERNFLHNPYSYKQIFDNLKHLEKNETQAQLRQDMETIDLRLHEDGWLPGMEIVMNQNGGFALKSQSESQWQQEVYQRQQQYDNPTYAAPEPSGPPGYNTDYSPTGGASGHGGYEPDEQYDPHKSGNPGHFQYDPRVSGNAAIRILEAAHSDIGHQMWRDTDNGESGAREGCAASVSAVLRQAGVAHVNEMECHHLQAALIKEGWTVSTRPAPGDVVFGYGGLSKAHVGIVGDKGTVLDNHSSTGQFSSDSLEYFGRWNKTVFLHPPTSKTERGPSRAKVTNA